MTEADGLWASIHADRQTAKMKLLAVPGGMLIAALARLIRQRAPERLASVV